MSLREKEAQKILLKPREAAELLSISQRKLWELTNRGDVPYVGVDRSVRYRPSSLEAWAQRQEGRRGATTTR